MAFNTKLPLTTLISFINGYNPDEKTTLGELKARHGFHTDDRHHPHRVGQSFEVIEVINEPTKEIDAEALPMFRIKFADGHEINAWADEIAILS